MLYELLFNHALEVVFRDPAGASSRPTLSLRPDEALAQVGFDREDGLLPYPPQSFVGYRLLSEFFAFPYKFHFVDIRGLRRACRAGYQDQLEIVLFLDRSWPKLEQDVTAETFRLGCTPVINLFSQTAEPIPMTRTKTEYRVVPDVASPDGMEVYSVDQVTSVDPIAGRDHRIPAVLLAPSRHDARRRPGFLVRRPKALGPASTTGGPRSISTW